MAKISFSLDAESINKAISEFEDYRKKVEELPKNIVTAVTEYGVESAKAMAEYMNAYDSGELVNGIVSEYEGDDTGRIVSTAAHSAFVEMGTGVVGKQSPGISIPGWQYDVNEHGEEGWTYLGKDGKWHWTKGMPSRPFMYDTAQVLKQSIPDIIRDELRKG